MIGYPRLSSLERIQDLHLKMAHRLDQRTTKKQTKTKNKQKLQLTAEK